MKSTILLFAGLLGLAGSMYAQTSPERRYDMTFSSGNTYQALGAGATEIAFDANWTDTVSAPVNLTMGFKYQNTPINTISIESLGGLTMNSTPLDGLGHIMGIAMEYASKGRAKIAYELTGTAGNRIFKVEYKNMGRENDAMGNDTLNYQIWLHESDNAIEYHTGYNNVPDTVFAQLISDIMAGKEIVTIGLAGNEGDSLGTDLDASFMHVVKDMGSQVFDTAFWINDLMSNPLLYTDYLIYGTYPAEGSVIRFVPKTGGVNIGKIDFNLATVYPNPSKNGRFNVLLKEQLQDATIMVYDITGKLVYNQKVNAQTTTIDLSQLPTGQYIGKLQSKAKTGVFKLVKE
ncbi:MAG: T9SS type A sorting domain-containing protein [Sphingobacteriales bacterium]|nr:MAG: T9SS type A sorting domain-containing protein [Sphingobacteriales bacterium]